jgi:hypothetical protein
MTVNPETIKIPFSSPSTVTAGTVLRVCVTIKDKCGNGYNGPVSLTAGDRRKLNVTTITMAGTKAGLVLGIRDTLYITATGGLLTGNSNLIIVG